MGTRNRRHTPPIDSLGISHCPTWIVSVDNWGNVLKRTKLDAGTDLYAALVQEHLQYHADGWAFEERLFYNREFHVRRAGDTPRRVYITSLDPARLRLDTEGHYDRYGFEFRVPLKETLRC